jgi:hypothetical protein
VTAHGIEIAPCAHPDRAGYFGGIFQFLEKRTLMTRQRDIGRRDKRGPACRGARSVSSSIGGKADSEKVIQAPTNRRISRLACGLGGLIWAL